MAGLYDRIADAEGVEGFDNHAFSSALRLLTLGVPLVTKVAIIARFGLSTADEVDLDAMQSHYSGLNANKKRDYVSIIMDAATLVESGMINEAQWRTIVGI